MEYVAAEAKLRAALRAILDQLDRYGCVYAESDTAAEARALLDGYERPDERPDEVRALATASEVRRLNRPPIR